MVRRRVIPAAAILAVCLMIPGPVAAQAPQPAPNVTGRVIDAFSMGPFAGARVTPAPSVPSRTATGASN